MKKIIVCLVLFCLGIGVFAGGNSEKNNSFIYVKNQTPEICLAAVRQDGMNLQYVKEQTPEICLAAVQQNGGAIMFVKKKRPKFVWQQFKEMVKT